MKTTSQEIDEIKTKIDNLLAKGIHSLYMFSEKITRETAMNVKNHFETEGYDIEVKSCPRKYWDIIVRF